MKSGSACPIYSAVVQPLKSKTGEETKGFEWSQEPISEVNNKIIDNGRVFSTVDIEKGCL